MDIRFIEHVSERARFLCVGGEKERKRRGKKRFVTITLAKMSIVCAYGIKIAKSKDARIFIYPVVY